VHAIKMAMETSPPADIATSSMNALRLLITMRVRVGS